MEVAVAERVAVGEAREGIDGGGAQVVGDIDRGTDEAEQPFAT